jgi:ribonuclease P protein component
MLGRANRFHGHGSVRRVYRLGKPMRTGLFSLHVLKNEKVRSSKVAVVVSRKIHKSAVKRNRIRRRIYEIVRPRLSDFKTPAELIITVYKPEVAELPATELQQAVDELLDKARL